MSRLSLKQRLDKVDMSKLPRRPVMDAEGYQRLRAVLAAEFGIKAAEVFRMDRCPVLAWLRTIVADTATAQDKALFERVAAVQYLTPPVTTRDFLCAMLKARSDF